MKKYSSVSGLIMVGLLLVSLIIIGEINDIPALSSLAGLLLGLYIPWAFYLSLDICDPSKWKILLRKLQRAGELRKDDNIRISFAYLFQIKIDNKYLLVMNSKGTSKYQPPGGAYKYETAEWEYLIDEFCVQEDQNIAPSQSTRNDYRLFVPVKNLKKFIKRFDKTKYRENVHNLKREFKEELINTGILDFDTISYKYLGRHYTKIVFSRHFQCYELLLADVVALQPSESQRKVLKDLMGSSSEAYRFATDEEIKACGINRGTDNLLESIADHSYKILQSSKDSLDRTEFSGKSFQIPID